MPTRYWQRGSNWQTGSGALPINGVSGSINLIEIGGAANPTSTMMRVLLDCSIGVTLAVPPPSPVLAGWETRVNSVIVGALEQQSGTTWPSTFATEDGEVTLTGTGFPSWSATSGSSPTLSVVCRNQVTLESKGERKLLPIGNYPCFRASIDIGSILDNLPGRTNFLHWSIWAYARVLWQDT